MLISVGNAFCRTEEPDDDTEQQHARRTAPGVISAAKTLPAVEKKTAIQGVGLRPLSSPLRLARPLRAAGESTRRAHSAPSRRFFA